jgi:polysaccharide export outer membrane protein
MHRHDGRTFAMCLGFLLAMLTVVPGCSTFTSGKGFSFFPQGHKLTDAAKDLRLANVGNLLLPRELDKQPLPPYTVEPGDVLLVQPVDLDSPVRLPGDQPVLPDGTINLGKYGHLMVFGRTVPEIETLVKQAVEAKTKEAGAAAAVTVRLVSRQSKVYYVVGEVNAPGAFQLNGRETVLDGLMAAGGLTDRASANNIILSRPSRPEECRVVLPVCYKNIVQLGDTTTNYQLAPGDRIFVPSRTACESVFPNRDKAPCDGCHTPCVLPRASGAAEHEASVLTPPLTSSSAREVLPVFRSAPRLAGGKSSDKPSYVAPLTEMPILAPAASLAGTSKN